MAAKNEHALEFGKYIHKIFEDGWNDATQESLYLLSEQVKGDFKVEATDVTATKKCIKNFVRFNSALKGETLATELKGELFLDEENDIKYNFVIDRVIRGVDGGLLIIDYKTSKKEKTKLDLYKDKQLKGYAYAASILFNTPLNKITCAHYYPVTNNFVTIRYNQSDITVWKKQEIKKVWGIRKKKANEFPPTKNQFCSFCEYAHICSLHTSECDVQKNLLIEEQKLENKKKSDDKGSV